MPRASLPTVCIVAGLGALFATACYSPPQPDCGFVCGPGGACPDGYTCAADNVCHRNGTPASLVCGIDAGQMIDAAIPDVMPDADLTEPTLVSSVPAANATAVSRTTTITVVFSEPVTNVSTTTFTVSDGSAVTGVITMTDAVTYVFTPDAMLANNATVTVTLDGTITDASGNALALTMFSFSTAN